MKSLEQLQRELTEELSIILGAEIGLEDNLIEAGLDSFAIMQTIAFLEDSYGIELADDILQFENFESVKLMLRWAFPLIQACD